MKVIVNADDLGAAESVNDAIFGLMADGRVTSATIICNGPAFAGAAERAQAFPNCSFGVHLNITANEPLTRSAALSRIVGSDGAFLHDGIRQVAIDEELAGAIFAEWDAQVRRAKAAGIQVTHLDSHHHVHTIPRLFPVLKRLQREHGIRRVRLTMNLYPSPAKPAASLLLKKRAWNAALRYFGRTTTTDGFSDLQTFIECGSRSTLEHRTFEVMVHPGDPDRKEETALLAGDWRARLQFPTTLISYAETGG